MALNSTWNHIDDYCWYSKFQAGRQIADDNKSENQILCMCLCGCVSVLVKTGEQWAFDNLLPHVLLDLLACHSVVSINRRKSNQCKYMIYRVLSNQFRRRFSSVFPCVSVSVWRLNASNHYNNDHKMNSDRLFGRKMFPDSIRNEIDEFSSSTEFGSFYSVAPL